MARILFIMTGSDHWTLNDGTTTPTGYWAEEAIVPLQAFEAASHEVVVATPGGIKSPLDPASLRVEDGDHYRRIDAASPALNHPVPLDSVSAADFDAVYVPGGHGPMEDLAVDAVSGALLTAFRDAAKPVGAVCHGPAALLAATRADGRTPSPAAPSPASPTRRRPWPARLPGLPGFCRPGWRRPGSPCGRRRPSTTTSRPMGTSSPVRTRRPRRPSLRRSSSGWAETGPRRSVAQPVTRVVNGAERTAVNPSALRGGEDPARACLVVHREAEAGA